VSTDTSLLLVLSLLLSGMALALWAGRHIGERRARLGSDGLSAGAMTVQSAIAGLVALLLAFTVAGAGERLDVRRRLIVDESNAIGTAWLRLDLLPADRRLVLRERFRAYLDTRIATFRKLPDVRAALAEVERGQAMQREIWADAVAAVRAERGVPAPALLLLPSLNAMIDLANTRTTVTQMHPPAAVFAMLVLVLIGSALYIGYATAGSRPVSWIHLIGFVLLHAVVFAVILDLEYPRVGFLRESSFDQTLIDLRNSWR
jgi:hypothetical protein